MACGAFFFALLSFVTRQKPVSKRSGKISRSTYQPCCMLNVRPDMKSLTKTVHLEVVSDFLYDLGNLSKKAHTC
jgi:hypothetical protein